MDTKKLLRFAVLALLLALIAVNAFANARTWRFEYFSSAAFTTWVGTEYLPGVYCEAEYYMIGSTSDYREKYVYFPEENCGDGAYTKTCQQKINNVWVQITCP